MNSKNRIQEWTRTTWNEIPEKERKSYFWKPQTFSLNQGSRELFSHSTSSILILEALILISHLPGDKEGGKDCFPLLTWIAPTYFQFHRLVSETSWETYFSPMYQESWSLNDTSHTGQAQSSTFELASPLFLNQMELQGDKFSFTCHLWAQALRVELALILSSTPSPAKGRNFQVLG